MTEELIDRLRAMYVANGTNYVQAAADKLEAQAERIKFLEADRNLEKKMRKDADTGGFEMKAPITQAQAWAVIAESAGWNVKELPVLPAQVSARVWIGSHWVDGNEMQYVYSEDGDGEPLYTADQLQAYGAACAAHAREMALSDAKAMGKTLTYQPTDPIDFTAYQEGYMDAITEFYAAIEVLKGK